MTLSPMTLGAESDQPLDIGPVPIGFSLPPGFLRTEMCLVDCHRVIECYGKSCSNAANQNWANVCGSCPERRSCLLPQLINVRAVPARNERKLRIVGRSIGGFGLSRCGTVKLTLTAQNRERERRRKRLADYRGEDEASEFNFCSISSS
jgi:hypothetical protein